ncbi:MAG: hypothetical protein M1274_14945 [Actinobacteria bacterium]|nr:hypothetical protein [Actinomycetota bacterium]
MGSMAGDADGARGVLIEQLRVRGGLVGGELLRVTALARLDGYLLVVLRGVSLMLGDRVDESPVAARALVLPVDRGGELLGIDVERRRLAFLRRGVGEVGVGAPRSRGRLFGRANPAG